MIIPTYPLLLLSVSMAVEFRVVLVVPFIPTVVALKSVEDILLNQVWLSAAIACLVSLITVCRNTFIGIVISSHVVWVHLPLQVNMARNIGLRRKACQ